MGLIGLIAGYSIGSTLTLTPTGGVRAPSPIAQAPSAQPAPQIPQQPPPPPAGDIPAIDPKVDHIRGDVNAEITIVEYSDFECPFCQRHHPTMQQLVDEYKGKVNWVYRHFPLSFHPNAEPAAIASECAAEIGGNDAFWKFTDKVFETQGEWNYESYAKDIGLDAAKFKECVASGKWKQHVQDDTNGGSQGGIQGTPGNIVMSNKTKEKRLVSGAQPTQNFKTVIDELLGS